MDKKGRYTTKSLCEMFFKDFSIDELYTFDKKGVATVHEMTSADQIIIEDEQFDYLKDFYGIYDGEPIPQMFNKVVIEWKRMDKLIHIYVVFPEDKPNWVYLDVYLEWKYVGKILMPNLPLSESERNENGRFKFYSPFYSAKAFKGPNAIEAENELITEVRNLFIYTFLYVSANRENVQLYKEDTAKLRKSNNDNQTTKRRVYYLNLQIKRKTEEVC